jgi:RNA polymerase sigma-70 factor (family 1)
MTDPETELWLLVKRDDRTAFASLFDRLYGLLCLLSCRYTKDITTSREIVQDLFIHLWENRSKIEITTSVKSYMAQAVRFNSIRRVNCDSRSNLSLEKISEKNDEDFYDQLEYAELQNQILKAIDSLPEQCKKVFTLHRYDNLTYRKIASLLNISEKTVEAHISKALRIIQEFL